MYTNTQKSFSEAFKIQIVKEVESGTISNRDANRKYGILGHSTISKWRKKYGTLPAINEYIKQREHMERKANELEDLKNEVNNLKLELENAHLENTVLNTMLTIAEKEFDIPIRKKYGGKQCEK